MNTFAYVYGNPMSWIDLLGLFGDGTNYGPESGPYVARGHSDFPGSDRFDYTKEDHGWTSPYNPITTWRHFRDQKSIESDLMDDVEKCNKEAFERHMHQGQDYFSHYNKGYRMWTPLGHAFMWHAPDMDMSAWIFAKEWTKKWVEKWDKSCGCQK